ncbi:accessory Sec system protein Asp2 [Fructobacillus sp. M2-14]|uniref:Accessory Sec system protein Asp2 n=1 Tax=Fructobacillus broussonetiae TaxID=2713173 RepID=A0ABS5QZ37_9LACO|nr:accessory Sec system protein Asp2 [Fructobacillus broussonetiae]MBS9338463.1 accessory Sec system protein Asp2 [Fructobacillus broussonetiae]
MAKTLSVLQIGSTDWTEEAADSNIDWRFWDKNELPVFLAKQKDPDALTSSYVLLTDEEIDSNLLAKQVQAWPAHRVLYTGDATRFSPKMQNALVERYAISLKEKEPTDVFFRIEQDLFLGQIGFPTRFSEDQFIPQNNYALHQKRTGRFCYEIEGDFGDSYQQIGTLRTFPGDLSAGQENLLYADYEKEGDVSLAFSFIFFKNGGLQQMKLFENPDKELLPAVRAPKDYLDYQILVLAKGKGKLTLKNLHQRRSRHGLGHFLPGGKRMLTTDGEEVLSYFNPGTKKGPLVVAFAGTRLHVEGFEMMGSLNELGYPYLLFTDTRAQGGAFMVGQQSFENLVESRIREAQLMAGLTSEETIFTGYSMGSYPAMYYASLLNAEKLVIGKPIINLGKFTGRPEFAHHGMNHDWTLDLRYVLTGRLDEEDNQFLDQKLWKNFQENNFRPKQVACFAMIHDEYDGSSLPQLEDYFKEVGSRYDKHEEVGHHEEKVPEMLAYIKKAIKKQAKKGVK